MSEYLKKIIEQNRENDLIEEANCLDLLLSRDSDAKEIRKWLKSHARPEIAKDFENQTNELQCEDWEAELWFLNQIFTYCSGPMTAWQATPDKERKRYVKRIRSLSLDLANLLEKENAPYFPPVLEFFDENRSVDIIRELRDAESLLESTGFSPDPETRYQRTQYSIGSLTREENFKNPSQSLSDLFRYPGTQYFPALLRRLSNYAPNVEREHKPDYRPKQAGSQTRSFARSIVAHFAHCFDISPWVVAALCVNLKFADLEDPVTADNIRDWHGLK